MKNLKEERLGLEKYNFQDLKMKIIEYNTANDLIVEFEDGFRTHSTFQCWKLGNIKNYNYRIGEVSYNKQGTKGEIIQYDKNYNHITIKINDDDNEILETTYDKFQKGLFKSYKYSKIINGIGILDMPKSEFRNTDRKCYNMWRGMLERCYNPSPKYVAYKDCTVCDEWKKYSNFSKWFRENYYEIDGEIMALDKDILHKGNKIYSPNSCCIVPQRINSLFINWKNKKDNDIPTGIRLRDNGKYYVKTQIGGLNDDLFPSGTFDSLEEAFEYRKAQKLLGIKLIAEKYRNYIPTSVYDAIINWKVEFDD